MFKLNEKYEGSKSILKYDYISYSPGEISTLKTADSQIFNTIPRKNAIISLFNRYHNLNFEVLHAATGNSYTNANDRGLVNLDPVACFISYKLTTSRGKHLEDIKQALIIFLMLKLIINAKDTDDLSIGFEGDRGRRQ